MKIICKGCKKEIKKGHACPLIDMKTKKIHSFCELCYFELTKEEVNDEDNNSI